MKRALATVAGVGAMLSIAGCGGAATPSASSSAVAFSHCMRAHGVSRFPDPTTAGVVPKRSLEQLGVGGSRFASAQNACRQLLPNGGRPPNQAERRQVRALALRFSQCVRAHGVPGFPDPASDGRIPDPASAGIDQGSPKFEDANRACGRYRPPYLPSNSDFNAWARTHGS